MRVYCNVGEIPCEVEFVGMSLEIKWVGSHVRGRRGAMDTYRTLKPTSPLYSKAVEAAKAKRLTHQPEGNDHGR